MPNEMKEAKVKELMKRIMDDMDELKRVSEDYWRVLIIAFCDEEKKTTRKKLHDNTTSVEQAAQDSSLQERMLILVHDAIYMTYMETGKYDPVAVRNWFGYDKEVRNILKQMSEDVFNATFGALAEETIKEITQPAPKTNQPKIKYASNSCEAMYMDD